VPVALFEKLPELAPTLSSAPRFYLIFNLDYLETMRGEFGRVEQQILWLSNKRNYVVGLVSGRQINDLRNRFDGAPLVLIGENGFAIEGRDYSWEYPALRQTRAYLQQLPQDLQARLGIMFPPRNYTYSSDELWLKIALPDKNMLPKLVTAFREINPPGLDLICTNGLVQIEPQLKWDRGRAVGMVIQVEGPRELFFPQVLYFGGDDRDEAVFKAVNRYGWSVIVRACPTQHTSAHYSLRDLAELNKFLYWLNAG
jgi:trehalose-6-phosphatase